MLPFVGVDGEGGDVDDGTGFTTHTYTMLRAGDRYVTGGWLPFLASLPKRQIHVAYFFDYDVTMMLRDLPPDDLRVLVAGGVIRHGQFELGYRPRKEFTIKTGGRITTINDVGTFFQCKFLRALEQWGIGSPEQRATIADGKESRGEFGALTAQTVEYNRQECILLEELMTKFRHTCDVIGFLPRKWQGPGQLAKAMFAKHGIPKTDDLPSPNRPYVWEYAQAAYYGGRFETSAVGPIKGPVEGWDINSAYPFAATQLPCLTHGKWIQSRSISPFGLYKVRFTHAREQTWNSLPIRTSSGSIHFPRSGSGWYWGMEILSGLALGLQPTVVSGVEYVTHCTCVPFNFMERLYSIRKGLGKSEAGLALKYAMNSAYGICAQSIGQAPYANPIWAGLFTAITRARINDALAHDPHNVYMVATDGLFCRGGSLLLGESNTLGGWEKTVYPEGMHIVMPGVYFVGHKDTCLPGVECKCAPKTRGVPQAAVLREEVGIRGAWTGSPEDKYRVDLRQFIGLRLGIARNRPDTLGQWLPVKKAIGYDWSTKRRPTLLRRGVDGMRTMPYNGDVDTWTVPYSKMIGGNLARNMDRLDFADQPDWAETLTEAL